MAHRVLADVAYHSGIHRRIVIGANHAGVVSILPDGQTAVSVECAVKTENDRCDTGNLTLWDINSGTLLRRLEAYNVDGALSVQSVAISPDGTTAVTGGCAESDGISCTQGELIVWDLATGQIIRRLRGHSTSVSAVTFSPDGQSFVSIGQPFGERTLILWDAATGFELRQFTVGVVE